MSKSKSNKLYILVRSDLSKPQQMVQAAHAALEASMRGIVKDEHPAFVILSAGNYKSFLWLRDQHVGEKVSFYEPHYGEWTAFATMERHETFDSLKLL